MLGAAGDSSAGHIRPKSAEKNVTRNYYNYRSVVTGREPAQQQDRLSVCWLCFEAS